MKPSNVWHGHSTRPSLPAGTVRKANGSSPRGRRNKLITLPAKRNRAFPMGNALLYISLSSVVFGRVRPQDAPCFCFAFNLLTMASSHILQIFLRVTVQDQVCIAQWGIVDEVVQLCPLHHGYIKCILQGQCNLLLHERASTNIQPYTRCRLNSLTRTLVSLNAVNILISVPLLTFLSQSWYNANVQEGVYVL